MRILSTSDLHGHLAKYKTILKCAARHKVDAVVLAGDLLDNRDPMILSQKKFCFELYHIMLELAGNGIHTIYILGNDDVSAMDTVMFSYTEKHPMIHWVDHRTTEVNGYIFTGMSEVKDLPYGLKDRARLDYDNDSPYDILQPHMAYLTTPCIKDNAEWVPMPIEKFLKEHLPAQHSLSRILWNLPVNDADWHRTVLITHDPPKGVGLDITGGGESVGSQAVFDFIVDVQPRVSIHGHIHESPKMTGVWKTEINKTLSIQAGQGWHVLFYSVVDLDTLEVERYSEVMS